MSRGQESPQGERLGKEGSQLFRKQCEAPTTGNDLSLSHSFTLFDLMFPDFSLGYFLIKPLSFARSSVLTVYIAMKLLI